MARWSFPQLDPVRLAAGASPAPRGNVPAPTKPRAAGCLGRRQSPDRRRPQPSAPVARRRHALPPTCRAASGLPLQRNYRLIQRPSQSEPAQFIDEAPCSPGTGCTGVIGASSDAARDWSAFGRCRGDGRASLRYQPAAKPSTPPSRQNASGRRRGQGFRAARVFFRARHARARPGRVPGAAIEQRWPSSRSLRRARSTANPPSGALPRGLWCRHTRF